MPNEGSASPNIVEFLRVDPPPKKDELLVLWHKQCQDAREQQRRSFKPRAKYDRQRGEKQTSRLQSDEMKPNLYKSVPATTLAVWCPPLRYECPISPRNQSMSGIDTGSLLSLSRIAQEDAIKYTNARQSTPRSEVLFSTKESFWVESLRTSPISGSQTDRPLSSATSPTRPSTVGSSVLLSPRPFSTGGLFFPDKSTPRIRRAIFMERALSGATPAISLDLSTLYAPASASNSTPRARSVGSPRRQQQPRRGEPPPMVFKSTRPELLDSRLTTMEISRDWFLQNQEQRARAKLYLGDPPR